MTSGPWDNYTPSSLPPALTDIGPDQGATSDGPTVPQLLASNPSAGPWDKYAAPVADGPWSKYASMNTPAASDDGEAYKGLRRGLTETGEALKMLPDVAEASFNKHIAPVFDQDKIKQDALAYQKAIDASNAQYPDAVPSYKDIHSASDLAKYGASALGGAAPGLAMMAIPGGFAGSMAKEGAELAAKEAVQSAAVEAIGGLSEQAGTKIADKAAQSFINKATVAGSAAGAASTAIPQDYTSWLNRGVDAPDTAIFAGGVTGGLMAVMPGTVMGKVLGDDLGSQVLGANLMEKVGIRSPLIQKVLSHAVVGAAELGTAGATAEGLNLLAEHEIGLNPNLYTKENLNRVFEAGFTNAIGGAIMGAAAAPFINHAELGTTLSKEGNRPANVKPLDLTSTEHTKAFQEAQDLKEKTAVTAEQKQAVADDKMNVGIKNDDIKAQVAAGPSHSEDAQLTPVWMSKEQVKKYQDMGLSVEDMQKINPLDQIFAEHLIAESQDPKNKTFDDYSKAPEGTDPRPLEKVGIKDQNRLQEWSDEALNAKFQRTTPTLDSFKSWFGGSKVVDAQGQPQVMYHGTSKDVDFKRFNIGQRGAWFHPDPKEASMYAESNDSQGHKLDPDKPGWNLIPTNTRSRVIPTYLKMENPYFPSSEDYKKLYGDGNGNSYQKNQRDIANKAKKLGHDGIVLPGGTHVVFDPRQIKSIWNGEFDPHDSKFQRSLTGHPNLHQSFLQAHTFGNAFEGLEHTKEGLEKHVDVANALNRIGQELTGSAKFKFWDHLQTRFEKDPVRGAQYLNMIHVAINDSTSFANAKETLYHEVWHYLEGNGFITDADRALFDKNRDLAIEYMRKDGWLKDQDYDHLMKTQEGREEIRANMYGKMSREMNLDNKNTLPGIFKGMFGKARSLIQRIKYMLKGQDIKALQDFVRNTSEGGKMDQEGKGTVEKGRGQEPISSVEKIHENLMYNAATFRAQRMEQSQRKAESDEAMAKHREILQQYVDGKVPFRDAVKSSVIFDKNRMIRDNVGDRALWAQWLQTPARLSEESPFFSLLTNHFRNIKNSTANHMSRYNESLKEWNKADPMLKAQVGDLTAKMKIAGLKSKLNPDGQMEFMNESGSIIHLLKDKEASTLYGHLQKAMADVHEDRLNGYKTKAREVFKDILPKDYHTAEVDSAILALHGTDKISSERMDMLKELSENLHNSDVMKMHDYIPFSRFGHFGITVRDRNQPVLDKNGKKTGDYKQVALHTVESQHFNVPGNRGNYNMHQLQREVAKIKALYSDTKRYDVIGGQGKITNFDDHTKIHPFTIDKNAVGNQLDPRYLNTELLTSMINSSSMDPEMHKEIKEKLMGVVDAEANRRSFGKLFGKSEKTAGYSQDWNRVIHTYASGSAHILSNLEHAQDRAALDAAVKTLADHGLRKQSEAYMSYVGKPQDDLQTLRAFNYLWAMGGNFSSMLVQMSTLPTMSLGQMCKYSPHVLQNMTLIGKQFVHAAVYYAKGADHAALEHMVKSGRWTVDQANTFRRAEMDSHIQSPSQLEALGQRPYERESDAGKFKGKVKSITNMLSLPVFVGEQITRAATFMATHEMLQDKAVMDRFEKVHKNDMNWQTQKSTNNKLSPAENAGRYVLDTAHGVYGKEGRVATYRGVGGALFFPFMTFPHRAIERMITETHKQGSEGRIALGVTLGALALTSGLMGLPGASAATKLADEYEKRHKGIETNTEQMIYEKMAHMTGDSPTAAKMLTYGVGRAFLGTTIGARFGLPELPMQNALFNFLGVGTSTPSSQYGVEGSIISSFGNAYNAYQQGLGPATVAGAMMPNGIANLFKAYDLSQNGLRAGGKDPQTIIPPKDVSVGTILSKMGGITSDQIASMKTIFYAAKLDKSAGKYAGAFDRFKEQGISLATQRDKAAARGDGAGVSDYTNQINSLLADARQFVKENPGAKYPTTLIREINMEARQRATGAFPQAKNYQQRQQATETSKLYGYPGVYDGAVK